MFTEGSYAGDGLPRKPRRPNILKMANLKMYSSKLSLTLPPVPSFERMGVTVAKVVAEDALQLAPSSHVTVNKRSNGTNRSGRPLSLCERQLTASQALK